MSDKLSIVMMTKEESSTIANFITLEGNGFCARTCPRWSYSETVLLSFKYLKQGLRNYLYIIILDSKTNIPLNYENVLGTYLITPPPLPSLNLRIGKNHKVKLCAIGQQV